MCQALDIEHDCAPRIATPFGGGFGSCGLACGALAGGVMAVGLALGRRRPEESREAVNAATRELVDTFIEEMGSSLCRELIGIDLRSEEGRRQLHESDVLERVCGPAVAFAARRTAEILRA